MDTSAIYRQCEDYLFPAMQLSVRERVLYYHLLRHTHLEGKHSVLVGILPLAKKLNVAESSVREDIRSLNERGCIKIEERSRTGHFVRALLPDEIPGLLPEARDTPEVDIESLDCFTGRKFLSALLAREGNRCFYCLKAIQPLGCELDHVIAKVNGIDNSFRNIVCSCHECNTTKQAQAASDFVRALYRKGVLSQTELGDRLSSIEQLQAGELLPDSALIKSAL